MGRRGPWTVDRGGVDRAASGVEKSYTPRSLHTPLNTVYAPTVYAPAVYLPHPLPAALPTAMLFGTSPATPGILKRT